MSRPISLGQRFGFIGRSFKRKLDEMLKEEELTGVQFHVLSALVALEEAGKSEISQKDLEQATRLSHATMTEIVKRLEKKEYLACSVSPNDRRCKNIASTKRARQLKDRAAQVDEATADWLCRGLTEEQTAALREITDIMLKNIMENCRKGRDEAGD